VYDLTSFSFNDMMASRAALRSLFDGGEPATLAEAGERVVRLLYDQLGDAEGNRACALVRLFKTHRYDALPEELRRYVAGKAPEVERGEDVRCLVLLATAGDEPAWNDTRQSRGHRVIPLMSEAMVAQAPMIAQLITQFGISITNVLRPSRTLLLDLAERSFNVFYVPRALGSPYIVAQQEFVVRYGIQSVLGFGGMLATGDLFATILFSRVVIPPETADAFKVLGLNLKLAILPLARKPLF
jgi:two-component system NtrC family sensor kinase